MLDMLIQLALFTSKMIIVFIFIASILVLFIAVASRGKDKHKGKLVLKNLNKKYQTMANTILQETLPKKQLKAHLKEQARKDKARAENPLKNIYVLHFHGDIKASAVGGLSEEITTILNVANPTDEVVLRLESGGGFVHSYGLAAAQLSRIRARGITLTVTIDKIAASGGYLMACVANKIISAPFAIIGSIGVLVQLPNFHRLLKDNHVDFIQLTAGEYKRTVTMFGEDTESGREKLKQEIEDVHQLFKNLIKDNRQHIDINKVATGEHWLGLRALDLNLVDEIKVGDDYLLERSKDANLYELAYETKKPLLTKLTQTASLLREKLFSLSLYR